MKLATANIKESVSIGEDGGFFAHVNGHGKKMVVYTSPFKAGAEGGFVFPPLGGETVLVCQPDDETDLWYYMSTVYRSPGALGATGGGPMEDEQKAQIKKVDKDIYRAKGIPMKWVLGSPDGHKIIFSEEQGKGTPEDEEEKWENKRLEIRSAKGKSLKFLDSKEQECMYLINEHRDGIKITSHRDNPQSSARSIEVESLGPIKNISREGAIDIWVDDGRELNIVNNSTGKNKPVGEEAEGKEEHYGNVNIESKHRDVNIQSNAAGGRIYLTTTDEKAQAQSSVPAGQSAAPPVAGWAPWPQRIELETTAKGSLIRIYSKGNVEVRAEQGGIDMACKGDFKLNCDGTVHINGKEGVNIDSGLPALGKQIHLNSGRALAVYNPVVYPQDPVIKDNKDNEEQKTFYKNKGVY
tara:strand:- start:12716 stop:13945 length:1230 start_codon:yes stop_codon:yes gene_type:complete